MPFGRNFELVWTLIIEYCSVKTTCHSGRAPMKSGQLRIAEWLYSNKIRRWCLWQSPEANRPPSSLKTRPWTKWMIREARGVTKVIQGFAEGNRTMPGPGEMPDCIFPPSKGVPIKSGKARVNRAAWNEAGLKTRFTWRKMFPITRAWRNRLRARVRIIWILKKGGING